MDTKHQPGLVHDILDDEKIFKEARDSLEILLPKLLDLLYRTFKDRFHMNASGGKSRIFYYFATKDPLENIALTLGIKAHMPYLSMMYVPTALHGGADYKRGIEFKEVVEDPELAGLTMMRLARKLLSHAMPTPKHAARRSAA